MKKQLKIQQIDFTKEIGNDQAQVVEKDLRKPVKDTSIHPYNGIGKIITRLYDSEIEGYIEKSGTAFIVAKNLIMTAAHVLKFKKHKTICDNIQFFPQQLLREKQAVKTGIKVRLIHIRNEFIDLGDEVNKKFDFVFLQLQQNNIITEDQVLPLDFNYKLKKQDIFNISGYGGSGIFSNVQFYEQNLAAGQKEDFLLYKHTTHGGNSGGPVLLKKKNNKYVVVGIHKGTITQHNYCLLLRSLNSPQVNNSSTKFSPSMNFQLLELQKWPQTYIKSYRQKDITYSQLKQQNKSLRQKLNKAENRIKELQQDIIHLEQKAHNEIIFKNLLKQTSFLKKEDFQLLAKWLMRPIQKIQLKFKRQKSFLIKKFVEKCVDLQNTIIIAKTGKGKIIGGYTASRFYPSDHKQTQKEQNKYIKYEKNSPFLFSLSEKQKFESIKDNNEINRFNYQDQEFIEFDSILRINVTRMEVDDSIGFHLGTYGIVKLVNILERQLYHRFKLGRNYYNTSKYPDNKQSYLKLTGYKDERCAVSQLQVYKVFFK